MIGQVWERDSTCFVFYLLSDHHVQQFAVASPLIPDALFPYSAPYASVCSFLIRQFPPQQNLLTMEQILTVEDTQIKDKKCILLRIKGGKQFVLQCEVGPAHDASLFCVCSQWGKKLMPLFIYFFLSLSLSLLLSLPVCLQSDPEFVQWKKELTEAFTEAQKLLRRAPKVIGKGRAGVMGLSKPPLTHRNSNGL